jgi:hypothetical protein
MSNEYLRKYLWMRSAYGVRVFFYESLLSDGAELRSLMKGKTQVVIQPETGWYELDIREHRRGLLIQVWATVKAVSPELCPEQSADGLVWPGIDGPMTHARASALTTQMPAFLDDKFLQRYEQSGLYDTTPVNVHGRWWCSPSYRGQWDFTECIRIGRNLISVPIRELYKGKPDREILHAHKFAVGPEHISHLDLKEEHIVAKTQRLLDQLLNFGDKLSALGECVGDRKSAVELVGFSRVEVRANGWTQYPQLSRLARVAPLDMNQDAFLSRCKSLHEIWQRVPDGFLKSLLEASGCLRLELNKLGSLKLLQALFNIITRLNANNETTSSFRSDAEREGWRDRNDIMAPLFLNNDLRIADAHERAETTLQTLRNMGFDTASLDQGYGQALDFMMKGVILAFAKINVELDRFLTR